VKVKPSLSELRDQLLQEISHFNMHYVAEAVGNDAVNFQKIMHILFTEKDPLPPRAAWVAEIVSGKHPAMVEKWIPELIQKLDSFTHPGSRRNILKILERNRVEDEDLQGILIETCFQWLSDRHKTTAVKVFSMQIIANYVKDYPELGLELKELIHAQLPDGSPGFRNRGKKVLNYIQKIIR
jgi:hypothetical protein